MPRIYVEFNRFNNLGETYNEASKSLINLQKSFKEEINRLDWEVKSKESISRDSMQISQKLSDLAIDLRDMNTFIEETRVRYQQLDQYGEDLNSFGSGSMGSYAGTGAYYGVAQPSNGSKSIFDFFSGKDGQNMFDGLGDFFGGVGKVFESKGLGFVGDLMDYFKNLGIVGQSGLVGLGGIAAVCGLYNSSTGLYEGFYKFLKSRQPNSENITKGIFGKTAGKVIGGVSLSGDAIGFIGSIISASQNLGSKDIPTIIADYAATGDDLIDFVADAYKLKNIANVTSLFGPADIYASIGKGSLDAGVQAVRSINEYSKDGEWSLEDTGNTGIEMSSAGIYGILDGLTFGNAEFITGAANAQELADNFKGFAKDVGTWIGNAVLKLKNR